MFLNAPCSQGGEGPRDMKSQTLPLHLARSAILEALADTCCPVWSFEGGALRSFTNLSTWNALGVCS